MARTATTTPGNVARVLRIVHEDGPVTRAELTRSTGLNRSTVLALVGELVERGLVHEEFPAAGTAGADRPAGVGRPSAVVRRSSRCRRQARPAISSSPASRCSTTPPAH